jgi:hypothetical protein
MIAATGCGGDVGDVNPDLGEGSGETEREVELKADRPDIPFQVVEGIGLSLAQKTAPRRMLFKTQSSFRNTFGFNAPVDLARKWLLFYSAGSKSAGGYSADILRIRVSDSGNTLKITTRLTSPGATCAQSQAMTTPHLFVSFDKPASGPWATRVFSTAKTQDCSAPCGSGARRGNGECPPAGVFPLAGIDSRLPHDDLEPLSRLVADSRVVAFGESVHTSGGYSTAKFRLFKYLVERHGFRAYGFETPWKDAELVSDYVATCRGNAKKAIRDGLFGVWANRVVLDLVEWMCQWNQRNPNDKLVFFGFDAQQPWDDARALKQLLESTGGSPLVAGLGQCDGANSASSADYYSTHGYPSFSGTIRPADFAACLSALDAVDAFLARREKHGDVPCQCVGRRL